MRDTFAVLRSTRDVVLDSGFVKINQEAVKKLAQDLAKTNRPGISEPFFLVRGWETVENIFHSYQGNRIPMLDQRLASLRQLGEHLDFRKPADLKALIKSWGGSAEKAVAFLIQLPVFDDTEVWRTVNGNLKVIKFYKRAQLAAKMINQVLSHEMPDYAFQDLEILTAFADYRLP